MVRPRAVSFIHSFETLVYRTRVEQSEIMHLGIPSWREDATYLITSPMGYWPPYSPYELRGIQGTIGRNVRLHPEEFSAGGIRRASVHRVDERRLGIVGKVVNPVVEHLDLITIRIAGQITCIGRKWGSADVTTDDATGEQTYS
jgi:hypothetical protein